LEQKIQEVEKKNEELQEVADSEIRRALKLWDDEKINQFQRNLYRKTLRKC
jgi:hypothetical protein